MKTTLLLIPGIFNDASLWDEVAPALAPLADVRRLDLLTQDSIPAMAEAAWEQLADLPPAAPVALVGFSMGGYVALEMLARPARPLRAAALVSTSARTESPEAAATREKTIAALPRHFERVVDGILQFGTHEATPQLLQELKPMMLRVGADIAVRQNRATMAR
ncbi:MAG TPA: alpha/beta fold hydrolase, partial [Ramlibacter sp.]|nr:alpha/beta fold hydrolase [Ramlibacter sp.]